MRLNSAAISISGIPLAFYGYLLQKTWGATEGIVVGFPSLMVGGFTSITCAVVALALAFASRVRNEKGTRKAALRIGVAVQIASALLDGTIVIVGLDSDGLLFTSLILKGVGTIIVSALWIELYAMLNPVRAGFLCAASTALSALALFIVEQVAGIHLLALRLTLTVFSLVLYGMAWQELEKGRLAPNLETQRFFIPYRAIAFILVYSFAYGIASTILAARSTNYAAVIPSLIVIALILLNSNKLTSTSLSRIALPLMIGGFMLTAFASNDFAPLSLLLLDTGYASMELLMLLLVCAAAYSSRGSALWLFGLMTATQFIGQFGGNLLAVALNAHEGTPEFVVMEIFAMVLVVAISPLIASDRSLNAFWKGTATVDGIPPESDRLMMRVDELSSKFGLTERESEVLYLAAQGKTNANIAADMILSEGTVKTHLHHVYRKFGIKTRTELMDITGK